MSPSNKCQTKECYNPIHINDFGKYAHCKEHFPEKNINEYMEIQNKIETNNLLFAIKKQIIELLDKNIILNITIEI